MRIGSNNPTLFALRQLSTTAKAISKSIARLSSGNRISSASDDPSGLAISERLTASIRGNAQFIRNINDVRGILTTVDSVLGEQGNIVMRMRELAIQAASGTLSSQDRTNLDTEFQQLSSEIDRLARDSTFNGRALLSGQDNQISLFYNSNYQQKISLFDTRQEKLFPCTISTGLLSNPVSYSQSGSFMELSDMNSDGNLDSVISSGSGLVVRLGRGDGTFGAATTLAAGSYQQVSLVDVDSDGDTDIVSDAANNIAVFNNQGNGTFTGPQNTSAGTNILGTATGDLNGDGRSDVAVGGWFGNELDVFIQQSNGSFTKQNISTDQVPSVAIGDINNDGNNDLVYGANGIGTLYRLGNGDGTFRSAVTIGSWTSSVRLADFNNDGRLDVIAGQGNGGTVEVMMQQANGTFAISSYLAGSTGNGLLQSYPTALDWNDDGITDIAITRPTDHTHINILVGNGNGTFKAMQTFNIDSSAGNEQIRSVDINNDGYQDIATIEGGSYFKVRLRETYQAYSSQIFNIKTQSNAEDAIETLDAVTTTLLGYRATLGAHLSRLDYVQSQKESEQINLTQSRSLLKDTDYSEELAEFTRQQILQQAGTVVLSQVNINMRLIIDLLK